MNQKLLAVNLNSVKTKDLADSMNSSRLLTHQVKYPKVHQKLDQIP